MPLEGDRRVRSPVTAGQGLYSDETPAFLVTCEGIWCARSPPGAWSSERKMTCGGWPRLSCQPHRRRTKVLPVTGFARNQAVPNRAVRSWRPPSPSRLFAGLRVWSTLARNLSMRRCARRGRRPDYGESSREACRHQVRVRALEGRSGARVQNCQLLSTTLRVWSPEMRIEGAQAK